MLVIYADCVTTFHYGSRTGKSPRPTEPRLRARTEADRRVHTRPLGIHTIAVSARYNLNVHVGESI